MSYRDRPWLARYAAGQPADIDVEHPTMLAAWQAAVREAPDRAAIKYFDGTITVSELDELSDAFAVALAERGVAQGDRVGVYLQNVPQFVIVLLAVWKIGAIAVSINPMNKERELATLLTDSGAVALVCLEDLYDVARKVVPGTDVQLVITTSELEYQTRDDPRVLGGIERVRHEGTEDMATLIDAHRGSTPAAVPIAPDDVAVLTYTSGTTGPPKGAMNTHRNFVFNAQTYRDWIGIGGQDAVFGVAPLFHITGLVGHVAIALLNPCTLILACRFEPNVTLDAVREHGATFTIGSITVFIALLNTPGAEREQLATLTKVYSGGAPVPPSTVEQFRDKFGHYIHCAYGLTETNSPSHLVPFGAKAPVDPASGAMSIGVPVYNTVVRIVDENRDDLPPGEIGELVVEGPEVVPGYWNKPEETAQALPGGALHTGDVGYLDNHGWFYLVDRKKDQINASGYKVWPREVEDVLYEHPAVREAAVVGVPDEYRGESVKAFVSLKPGMSADERELIEFSKERLAAYKYPRSIEQLDELPKTVTGKILRRELRGAT
ncbi:MAG: AMP-binding protein [Pseudonocardiaceae bacterium]|nr:AMP-binding protein [Pseudonocardiaceae bacterium]